MVTFTGIVHPKMKFLSLFARLYVLQNPFYFFSGTKREFLKNIHIHYCAKVLGC